MFVIATAGHVDHGKSTLIRAVTGMEPDRWAEERRRGMTIDLGYAWTSLPGGDRVVFVDVPGHERFMTNMLAGVGAVPAALLVVAADEGWGQQTSEHVRALNCLDIRHALLAVTRCDLGDGDLAIQEARLHLEQTQLHGIEAVTVSGLTGDGIPQLLAALARLGRTLPPPPDHPPRLWVDRSFSVRGAGTVVTGTLAHGQIRVGDALLNSRTGSALTVRGIETLKQPVSTAAAIARVALNLRGASVADIRRGDALLAPGSWLSVTEFDAQLVQPRERIPRGLELHVGSARLEVECRALGANHIRVRCAQPLPLRQGDRGLLRAPGGTIVAGIRVRDPLPPRLTRRGAAAARGVELSGSQFLTVAGQLRARKVESVERLQRAGFDWHDADLPPEYHRVGDWLVDVSRWRHWVRQLNSVVDATSAETPTSPSVNPADVMRRLEIPDTEILTALVGESGLRWDGSGIHRDGVRPALPEGAESALTRVERALVRNPFAAPELAALRAEGLDETALSVALQLGRLLRVDTGVYLLPDAPAQARRRLADLSGPFTVADARAALGGTRRTIVPLMEYLDRTGATRRIDSTRRVLRGQDNGVEPEGRQMCD